MVYNAVLLSFQRPSQLNLSSPNGHIQEGANGLSNGDSHLQPIQEEREDSSELDGVIQVCSLKFETMCNNIADRISVDFASHLTLSLLRGGVRLVLNAKTFLFN